jgi:hypothetical protein
LQEGFQFGDAGSKGVDGVGGLAHDSLFFLPRKAWR